MNRKPFNSAGHSNVKGRDRGAAGNGYIEGVETARIVQRIDFYLRKMYGLEVESCFGDTILSDVLKKWKHKTTVDCLATEWHFNAAAPNVTGTETFVPDNATQLECELAYCLSHVAHVELGTPKRGNFRGYLGVRPESESARRKLGWMTLTGVNVLPEVEFISHAEGMQSYEKNFESYCEGCAIVIYHFAIGKEKELLEKIR
jgi:N-acetylmuramoyl-L-alanine amidase